MVSAPYQPDDGDFVYLDFNPQAGIEQAGRRPALVVSKKLANIGTGLAFVVPITNQVKGGPLEVVIPPGQPFTGVALPEHMRSVDWEERRIVFKAKAPAQVVQEVKAKLAALLGL